MRNFFVALLLFAGFVLRAGEPAVKVSSLSYSLGLGKYITNSAGIIVSDDWYGTSFSSLFTVNSSRSDVVLRFDETKRKYYSQSWSLDVTYTIITNDVSGTPSSPTTHTISINYDPAANFTDKSIQSYDNSFSAGITIVACTLYVNGTYTSWANGVNYPDVYLDLEQRTERCWIPQDDYTYPHYTDGFNTTTPANNELALSWENLPWAESYDLEWVFIDVPSATFSHSYSSSPAFWKNATRINTTDNHYNISLAYPRGIFYFHVRAVGVDAGDCATRAEGRWNDYTGIPEDPSFDWFFDWNGLDPTFNWQYTASYAEDGKRKEVINYFDGSLHSRQTVTVLNTDKNAVIAETKYDYEGRGAVQMMPTPLASAGIKYYSNFNTGFNRSNFDIDSKVTSPGALNSSTSATNAYYSSSNTLPGLFNAYIPDAENYAYSRTRFMADGTNRVKSQSGVGATFKAGSGKETRYLYANPSSQDELDRLFGNEVGNVMHYQKNFVIDPNGQANVAYLDQEGRTIATALAGDPPSNLTEIDGKPDAVSVTEDILKGKNNFNNDGDLVDITTVPVVTPGSVYTFTYTLSSHCASITCGPSTSTISLGCEDCYYDIEIAVTDEDGQTSALTAGTATTSIIYVHPTPTFSCTTAANPYICTNVKEGDYTFTVTFPEVGVYRIIKTLKISQAHVEELKASYLTDQQEAAPEDRCIHFPAIIPENCDFGCESMCQEPYIKRNNLGNIIMKTGGGIQYYTEAGVAATSSTTPTEDEILDAIAACTTACNTSQVVSADAVPDPCDFKLQLLKQDMDPTKGGQYFLNTPEQYNADGTINSSYNWKKWLAGDGSVGANIMHESGTTFVDPLSSNSYSHFNDWFVGEICPTCTVTPHGNWDAIKNDWDNDWLDALVKYHPEYCHYQYECIETYCTGGSVDMASSNSFDITLYAQTTSTTTAADGYFTPYTNSSAFTGTVTAGVAADNMDYLPSGTYTVSSTVLDPLFAANCGDPIKTLSITCGSSHKEFQDAMDDYLRNFIVFSTPTSTVCTASPVTRTYNIWYLLDDPDDIHTDWATSYACDLPQEVIDYFRILHGDPGDPTDYPGIIGTGAGQVSKYQYFLSIYEFFKKEIIYKYNLEAHSACSYTLDPDGNGSYNMDGYDGDFIAHFKPNVMYEAMDPCDYGGDIYTTVSGNLSGSGSPDVANCKQACEGYAQEWVDRIAACTTGFTHSRLDDIKHYLVDICQGNCSSTNIQGTDGTGCSTGCYTVNTCSTSCTGYTCSTCTSVTTFTTFEDVINYFAPSCNIVPAHPLSSDQITGDCDCKQIAAILSEQNITGSYSYSGIASNISVNMGITVTATQVQTWIEKCGIANTGGTLFVPPDKDDLSVTTGSVTVVFPAELGCNDPADDDYNPATCSCDNLHHFFAALNLSETNADHRTIIANHLNDWLNPTTAFTASNVNTWLSVCNSTSVTPSITTLESDGFPAQLECPQPEDPEDNDDVADAYGKSICFKQNLQAAMDAAVNSYLHDLQADKDNYISGYIAGCKEAVIGHEVFSMQYDRNEYWYTLYYYDQAGNLIKTVAPQGVDELNSTEITAVQSYRAGTSGSTFTVPAHAFVSQYKFNSLQHPVTQTTPDGGTSNFYYDALGRLVVSQNERQLNNNDDVSQAYPSYSYTKYDELGRPYETGEVDISAVMSQSVAANNSSLASWYATSGAVYNEVVKTFYDESTTFYGTDVSTYFGSEGQQNLRNRISSVVYFENFDPAHPDHFDNASHYSYDIHGNVKTLIQHNYDLDGTGYDKIRIDYAYDLVSGNVNKVSYQHGMPDRFYHKYFYDADNRLTRAMSSHDNRIWETESKNFYYPHGPIGRMEVGDKQVAGSDYAYTLQGWIKGVNGNMMQRNYEMGQDATQAGLNVHFTTDAFGYTLGYFLGDYIAVNSSAPKFEATNPIGTGYSFGNAIKNLYNGNISHMVTGQMKTDQSLLDVQGNVYEYDQLNRIKQAVRYSDQTSLTGSHTWSTSASNNSYKYLEEFWYDYNGNITKADRNGHHSGATSAMDHLAYKYQTLLGSSYDPLSPSFSSGDGPTNKLAYVTDLSSISSNYTDDIDVQSSGNYGYDEIGNLTSDAQEQIATIDWKVNGKIRSITRTGGSLKPDLVFTYDAMGNRLTKTVVPKTTGGITDNARITTTYYVRDAHGNVLSIYNQTGVETPDLYLKEQNIFGSSQLGTYKPDLDLSTATTPASTGTIVYSRTRGLKQYIGANHLGNVLTTISDRKLAQDIYTYTGSGTDYTYSSANNIYLYTPGTGTKSQSSGTDGLVDVYQPDVISSTDYFAFGAPMGDRTFSPDQFRYGFNGKENDRETVGTGEGTQDYGMRIYNPALGRFLSVDPLSSQYAFYTPYQFAGNKPIVAIDLDGEEDKWVHMYQQKDGTMFVLHETNANEVENEVTKANNAKEFGDDRLKNGGVLYTVLKEGETKPQVLNYTPEFTISPSLWQVFKDKASPSAVLESVGGAGDKLANSMMGSFENYGVDEGEKGRVKWRDRGYTAAKVLKYGGKVWKPLAVPGEILEKMILFTDICADLETGRKYNALTKIMWEGVDQLKNGAVEAGTEGMNKYKKMGVETVVDEGLDQIKDKVLEKADENDKEHRDLSGVVPE